MPGVLKDHNLVLCICSSLQRSPTTLPGMEVGAVQYCSESKGNGDPPSESSLIVGSRLNNTLTMFVFQIC
jgi:hypothetical protein